MKKADIFLIIFFIVSSIALSFYVTYNNIDYNNKYLIVKVDNEIFVKRDLPVEKKETIPIKTKYGYNLIEIDKDVVRIIEADCHNQICVKDGSIKNVGEVLVCLPHKLIVEIKGKSDSEVDITN
ncbi:NusG domain II-containing protein [Clostridiaceae bacterium HSG29]|nr:NusG domain II-containing protein [Clostridiaceae bacterium HSG29]